MCTWYLYNNVHQLYFNEKNSDWRLGSEKSHFMHWKWLENKGSNTHLNKVNFKTNSITFCQWHYIIIKGSIQEEDKTFVNIYAPNIRTSEYVKQILTCKGRNGQ